MESPNVVPLRRRPKVYPREAHSLSRTAIDKNALKVLYRLRNAGFQAHLVGGSVRDLLLGLAVKDFDVVTDAHPKQVRELFRNGRLIGRRFRLVHVRYGNEIIEVSTFRTAHHVTDADGEMVDGRIIRDNVYGTIDDDVWRRDLTVNALFYNIKDFSVIDYVGGMDDLQSRVIRLIGDPRRRYIEDPVRLLRVVRFAVKLGFDIHPDTLRPISELADSLADIPAARLFEECLKLFFAGKALATWNRLLELGLLGPLFPQTHALLSSGRDPLAAALLLEALRNTDKRIRAGQPVTPGFLLAAVLWAPFRRRYMDNISKGLDESDAIGFAADVVVSRQVANTAMPRRFTYMAKEIWEMQPRLRKTSGKAPARLLSHPRFRAAYDFLCLRGAAGDKVGELADWWTKYQEDNPVEPRSVSGRPPRRRRYRGRKRSGNQRHDD